MLYPTWLSSYTHLLREDIRPMSLLSVIGIDRPARFIIKPVVSPPQSVSAASTISTATNVVKATTNAVKATTNAVKATTNAVKATTNAVKATPTNPAKAAKPFTPSTKPITVSDKHSKAGSHAVLSEL